MSAFHENRMNRITNNVKLLHGINCDVNRIRDNAREKFSLLDFLLDELEEIDAQLPLHANQVEHDKLIRLKEEKKNEIVKLWNEIEELLKAAENLLDEGKKAYVLVQTDLIAFNISENKCQPEIFH